MSLVAVACGGAVGALLRVAAMRAVDALLGSFFPHALYVVNTLGSFVLGIVVGTVDPSHHPFLIGGLCGALTTFSTFAHASVQLLREGRFQHWLLHNAFNMAGSLIGVAVGMAMTSR